MSLQYACADSRGGGTDLIPALCGLRCRTSSLARITPYAQAHESKEGHILPRKTLRMTASNMFLFLILNFENVNRLNLNYGSF